VRKKAVPALYRADSGQPPPDFFSEMFKFLKCQPAGYLFAPMPGYDVLEDNNTPNETRRKTP